MAIWIRHGIVISSGTKPQIWTPGRVLIEGDRVTRVEADAGEAHPAGQETIDASGCVLFPGQILLHTHCYGLPARGMPSLGKPPRTFVDVLRCVWWPLDRALTLPAVGLAARLYLWELLRAGVTCAFDHHASYGAIRGSLAEIASAYGEIGLRGGTCFEISSRCGAKAAEAAIEENVHYIRDIAPRFRLAPLIGLHASFTLSEKVVEHVAALTEELGVGVHSHLCEGPTDRRLSGGSPVRRWARLGFLNEKSIFAHGTDLRQAECELLAESGATIVLNPRSNLSNAVGLPDVLNLSRHGVRLALGNDGFGASLCSEAQTALGTFATRAREPGSGWELLSQILFVNNPEIAGRHLGTTLGVIQPGAAADIAIIPYHPPTPIDTSNMLDHYLFGFGSVLARDVIVAGKVRMRHGAPIGFQPEEWAAQAQHIFPDVWRQRSLRGFRVSRIV